MNRPQTPAPAFPATVVAESRGLVRSGLARLLGSLPGWRPGSVAEAATLGDALSLLSGTAEPPLLLLDPELLGPAGLSGLAAIRARVPGVRIIVLIRRESRDGILACLAAGAHGTLADTAEPAELARATETVLNGGVHVPSALVGPGPAPVPAASCPPALTGRQQDVLRLLAEGRSTKDIARTLDLAVSTIKVHLAALYRTVGARNRVEALRRAGILPSPIQVA